MPATTPGRLRHNRWPASIGTCGRVQSESPAAIVGIRIHLVGLMISGGDLTAEGCARLQMTRPELPLFWRVRSTCWRNQIAINCILIRSSTGGQCRDVAAILSCTRMLERAPVSQTAVSCLVAGGSCRLSESIRQLPSASSPALEFPHLVARQLGRAGEVAHGPSESRPRNPTLDRDNCHRSKIARARPPRPGQTTYRCRVSSRAWCVRNAGPSAPTSERICRRGRGSDSVKAEC
jgi:hypothetical protein